MNRVSELLVGSKMAITLELKLCLSNFSRGIEKQKGHQGTTIEFDLISGFYCQIQVKFLRSMQSSLFYGSLNVYIVGFAD